MLRFPRFLALLALSAACATPERAPVPKATHDGLHRVDLPGVKVAYEKPGVDYGDYDKILLLETLVAFKKEWKREAGRRISASQRRHIRERIAEDFHKIFRRELETEGGYRLTDAPGPDVLLVRAAIIDVYIEATGDFAPGRSTTFVTSEGYATLVGEAYDSESGEILSRVEP